MKLPRVTIKVVLQEWVVTVIWVIVALLIERLFSFLLSSVRDVGYCYFLETSGGTNVITVRGGSNA